MAQKMDPILPILSILGYWAIILGSFGGPGMCILCSTFLSSALLYSSLLSFVLLYSALLYSTLLTGPSSNQLSVLCSRLDYTRLYSTVLCSFFLREIMQHSLHLLYYSTLYVAISNYTTPCMGPFRIRALSLIWAAGVGGVLPTESPPLAVPEGLR